MNLLEWRKAKNLNQADASKLLDIGQGTISRIETGEMFPSPETLAQINERTNGAVTADDLHAEYMAIKRSKVA